MSDLTVGELIKALNKLVKKDPKVRDYYMSTDGGNNSFDNKEISVGTTEWLVHPCGTCETCGAENAEEKVVYIVNLLRKV